MEVLVKKWGNSAAVRIPASVVEAAQLKLDQTVDVRAEHGRIVIEPRRARTFTLADLVRRIAPANLHDAVDTGPAQGREVW
ncbi:MAG: PbsX family transcriptional regulator [Betaproteobacteria bacterium RIFCSPLOWO2_12_FULL_65_110]|nr:MAG: PbsX family transcriptional regulator [Betaproteobacteria bacterium RIFCSPLOWO2_12_FULL_65_110]